MNKKEMRMNRKRGSMSPGALRKRRRSDIAEKEGGDVARDERLNEKKKCLIQKENEYPVVNNYLNRQPELTAYMRSVLLDWMAEVCEAYRLTRETFHLSVAYVDRFLALTPTVLKKELQLVGVSALMIAAKLEEICPPSPQLFVQLTESAYSVAELVAMEKKMLLTFKWKLHPATAVSWLCLNLRELEFFRGNPTNIHLPGISLEIEFKYCMRIIDLCLLDIRSTEFNPSVITAATLMVLMSDEKAKLVRNLSHFSCHEALEECMDWIRSWVPHVSKKNLNRSQNFSEIATEDLYTIQSHVPGSATIVNSKLWEMCDSSGNATDSVHETSSVEHFEEKDSPEDDMTSVDMSPLSSQNSDLDSFL